MGTDLPGLPGEDFPCSLLEFEKRFATEEACRAYLAALRWPNGFRCPKCEANRSWPTGRVGLLECAACHYQVSVTAGTILEGTRKPLGLWFRAMWLVTSEKNGVSALGLQRQLGFDRYETAWTWLHKLRRAMVRPGRDRLVGHVEVDETYVGGVEEGVRGRETHKKSIVAIAVEVLSPKGFGRVRLCRIPDVSGDSLVPFVCDAVEAGALVRTDGWGGYNDLPKHGYDREQVVISNSGDPAHVSMPAVHRVAALLKRWLLGTHQGSVRPSHLDYYLDEFAFRFNRRTSRKRGKLFYRLVQQVMNVDPVSWEDVAAARRHRPQAVVGT
jgi:hypothetical protein